MHLLHVHQVPNPVAPGHLYPVERVPLALHLDEDHPVSGNLNI